MQKLFYYSFLNNLQINNQTSTNKTDIYGHYIADVFFSENEKDDEQKVADEWIYLNHMLIDLKAA
jgi:extradiol dioxygenase family protein